MGKGKHRVVVAGLAVVVLACMSLIAYLAYTNGNGGIGGIIKPEKESPLHADLRMHPFFQVRGETYAMAIGEEANFKITLNSTVENLNTTVAFNIPAGFQVSGGGGEAGLLVGKEPSLLEVMVRAVKVGKWEVDANVTSPRGSIDPKIIVCVGVTREDSNKICGE